MISSANSDRKEDNIYFKSVERWHGFTLGLNLVAAALKAGIEVENVAESGMMDFQQPVSFWHL